eukprot:5286548-Pyramimonas_sp.AAC.1
MYQHAVLKKALATAAATRITTYLGAFGGLSVKPVELYTTFPLEPDMLDSLRRPMKDAKGPGLSGKRKAKLHWGSDAKKPRTGTWGSKWVNFDKSALRDTQQYPHDFCKLTARIVSHFAGLRLFRNSE